jgi:hypothetical protein
MQKTSMGTFIAIVAAAIFLTVTATGLLAANQTIPTSGTVTSINCGVYSDSACTNSLTYISWGTVAPGGSVTKTIYIKNTGNITITLSMTKAGWNPASANGPITITWDREGYSYNPGAVASATLTLDVSSSISGITDFSVDIVITGTG